MFASLCSFVCLQAVYQLSGPVCKSTWRYCPCILLLTFISRFVIDFLSIKKIIIFSAIATEERHTLRSRSISKCCKLNRGRGLRLTYCARSRNDALPLTSRSSGMRSKKTMESLEDICRCTNCSKVRPHVSR